MGGPLPTHRHGSHGAAQAANGPEILNAQVVVGGDQHRGSLLPQQILGRQLAAAGEGETGGEQGVEFQAVGRGVQTGGGLSQRLQLPRFAAKGEHIHHPAGVQNLHAAPGKGLRRGDSPQGGELQHQVGAPQQGQPGPGPFVRNGALRPLDPVAAHHGYHGALRAQSGPGLGDVIGVTGMEGVIFRNDSDVL